MDFNSLVEFIEFQVDKNESGKIIEIDILDDNFRNDNTIIKKLDQMGYPFCNPTELTTFIKFVRLLSTWNISDIAISKYTNSFLFGYTIPQINKEFDLLRFGNNYNINIELKSNTTVLEQEEQLKKNHFYLNFLSVKTRYISVSPDISSYIEYLPKENRFKTINGEEFSTLFSNQEVMDYGLEQVNQFFDIKNYLVAPFNDTEKFMSDEYFLTNHQKEIVNTIINSKEKKVFGIKGNPGTGKSLLIYHIAKMLMNNQKKVVIIHGGMLNNGHILLNGRGFNIFPIYKLNEILNIASSFDYIILDEAQRLSESKSKQYTNLINAIWSSSAKFIISLDGRQTLNPTENRENSDKLFAFIRENGQVFGLKDKFRTNPELSKFVQHLLKIPESKEMIQNSDRNIKVKYFNSKKIADEYIRNKDIDSDWQVLNYTKDQYNNVGIDQMCSDGLTSHNVIGQEFDKIIIPLDSNFYYVEHEEKDKKTDQMKKFKQLKTTKNYYPLENMLYQNMTRARGKIELVVIENCVLFNEICGIVSNI